MHHAQPTALPPLRKRMSVVEVGDQIFRRQSSQGAPAGVGMGKHSSFIQTINNLRAVGAQMEVDLPCIALCGQKSSGKSSLTEAICGVYKNNTLSYDPSDITDKRLHEKEHNARLKVDQARAKVALRVRGRLRRGGRHAAPVYAQTH